jgi:hypothetical protein
MYPDLYPGHSTTFITIQYVPTVIYRVKTRQSSLITRHSCRFHYVRLRVQSCSATQIYFIFEISILCNSQTAAIEQHIGVSHAHNTDPTPAYYICSAALTV